MSPMRGIRARPAWAYGCGLLRGAVVALFLVSFAWACDFGLDVDALSRGSYPDDSGGIEKDSHEDETDAGADAGERPDVERCTLTRGGEMVLAADLCIDSTEVTNERYGQFLDSGFRFDAAANDPCDPGENYVPIAGWPAPSKGSHPVSNVTWCAARAFCAWAGKRLCGDRSADDGRLEPPLLGRPDSDEWSAVCSQGDTFDYVYGDSFRGDACNGDDFGVRETLPVGYKQECVPPDASAPTDLSGNVWEWVNSCDSTGGCFAHGGAYNSPSAELTCKSFVRVSRDAGLPTVGFRCCSR